MRSIRAHGKREPCLAGAWWLDLPLPFSWHQIKIRVLHHRKECLLFLRADCIENSSHTYHDKRESPRRPPRPRRQRIRRSAVRLERAHQVEPSRRNCRFRRRGRSSRGRLRRVNVRRGQRRGEKLSPPFLRLFLQLALRGQVIVTAATSLNAGEADDAVTRRRRRTPGERRGEELRWQAPDAVAAERPLQTGPRRRVVHLCVVHFCCVLCSTGVSRRLSCVGITQRELRQPFAQSRSHSVAVGKTSVSTTAEPTSSPNYSQNK